MWWFLMRDEPDIIKELREVEKLGGLWVQTTDNIAEFEVVEETTEDVPDGGVGFVKDNVEKKQEGANINNEKLPWKSEEKWRLLLENLPNIVLLVDRDGTIHYINHTVPGLTPEQVIGKNHIEFIPPEHHDMVKETIEQVFQTGNIGDYEIKGAGPKGSISWYASRIGPIKSDGQVAAVSIITTDITKRKKTKDALKESEEKFRTFVDTASDLMIIADKDGNFTDVNEAMTRALGYSKEELSGMRIPQILTKEYLENDFKPNWKKFVTNGEITIETTFATKDGKEIYGELKAVAIYDGNGKFAGSRTVFHDLTERKKVEAELRESKAKLESIFDSSPNSITVTDLEGNIVECNQATLNAHGFSSKDEVFGKSAFMFIAEKDYQIATENMKKTLEQGVIKNVEYTLCKKDGGEFSGELSVSVIKDTSGNPTGFVAITRDVTERRKADEILQGAKEKLERKIDELERYKKLTVGRELKMVELKNRIKELEEGVKK